MYCFYDKGRVRKKKGSRDSWTGRDGRVDGRVRQAGREGVMTGQEEYRVS